MSVIRIAIASLLALSPLAAGASRLVDNLKAGKSQVLVAYGTSLTAGGQWVADTKTWLSGLYPGQVTVINSGLSGKASNTGLANLQARVIANAPDAVFIEFAMNDAFSYASGDPDYGITVEKSKANLERMIDAILAARPACEIILQTMNPAWDAPNGNQSATKRPNLAAYYQGYRDVAAARGLLLIDHNANWLALQATNRSRFETYIPDGVHPSSTASSAVTSPAIRGALDAPSSAPAAPASLTAVAADGRVDLAWAGVTNAASYTVRRSLVEMGPYDLLASNQAAPAYADTGLANGTTYYYVVGAVNTLGESGPSAVASATPAGGAAVIKDNTDSSGVAFTGSWTSSALAGAYGTNSVYAAVNSGATARFTPTLSVAGRYEVSARWTASANRATNAPFTVVHAEGSTTVALNQQTNHATWVSLGTFRFAAGETGYVSLNSSGANGLVVADAVRFTLPSTPSVSVAASSAAVGEDSGDSIRFAISRKDTNQAPLVVGYTLGGTATAGADYTGQSGTVTLGVGAASAVVTLPVLADTLCEGDETVVCALSADSNYEVGAGLARVLVKDRAIDDWRFKNFTATQRADPAIVGDEADPDGDARPNLAEYALGTDPLSPDAAPVAVEFDDGHLAMVYRRRAPGGGVSYAPEISSDLVNWASGSLTLDDIFVADAGGGFSWNEARDIAPLPAAGGRFLRLRISAAP